MDDPDSWRTVYDERSGREIVLTDEDLELLRKIKSGEFVDSTAEDGDHDFTAYALNFAKTHNLAGLKPESKRRFVPSKFEQRRVAKIAQAIRAGYIVLDKPKIEKALEDIWASTGGEESFRVDHIPAPQLGLPGNNLSYNPPEEYLLNEKEKAAMISRVNAGNGKLRFDEPKKYSSLRTVPAYSQYIKGVYERCVDLVAYPRKMPRKQRIVDPDSLLPAIPDPSTLQPFPTSLAFIYTAHRRPIMCLSVDPAGKYLAIGSQDGYVFIFDVFTSRCLQRWYLGTETTKSSSATGIDANPAIDVKTKSETLDYEADTERAVRCLAWNPHKDVCILAAGIYNRIVLLLPQCANKNTQKNTQSLVSLAFASKETNSSPVSWVKPSGTEINSGHLIHLILPRTVTQVAWHSRGNYFTTTLRGANTDTVMIHQLSKRLSQMPFRKSKGLIQQVMFHPTAQILFVVTQRSVRIYNLSEKKIEKRLIPGVNHISSIDVHPGGDNLIVGSYDNVVSWFDLNMGNTPYKKLRHHSSAVRCVAYHKSYPLFASCDSKGRIYIFHCSVYSDLTKDPLIVPLKRILHSSYESSDALCCEFHPYQPWIFSGGSNGKVCLHTDVHT